MTRSPVWGEIAARQLLTWIDRNKERDEGGGMRDEAADYLSLIHPFSLIPLPLVALSIHVNF
jgi:hypothetical protein